MKFMAIPLIIDSKLKKQLTNGGRVFYTATDLKMVTLELADCLVLNRQQVLQH